MQRNKFTVNLRNKLSDLAMSCNSCAAESSMTDSEAEYINKEIRNIVNYIDSKI